MSIIIRLQNLPWAADSVDIRRYFSGLSIPEGGVHIVGGEMGDAFIGFSTDEDARLAMAKDGGKIHEMQIKLLLSSRTEMMRVIERARQQNLALQAHMSPIQPPPMMPLHQQMVIPAPSVDSDRRRGRSPSPHRRSRDKSPARDRRRSPDSRRSSSKRERSRSPARGSRGSSRDTDRRNDRYKRDDRRYDEPPRYRDDRYSGRAHSQDSKKYPETDSMNRPPARAHQPGEFRDATNRGYYEPPAASAPNTAYNYEASRNVSSSKDYPNNSYNSHNEKNSLPHSTGHNRMDMQPALNQLSSNLYGLLPPSFNLPSFEQPAASNKEAVPSSLVAGEEFGKRPRRSRFEPEYAPSEAPFFPSNAEQKPAVNETAREPMPYDDKRSMNQEYLAPARNSWPQQNNERSQNSNWNDKRQPLLEPAVQKNRDAPQVVPMDLESSPTNTPPDKSTLSQPEQYNPQRSSRPFPSNAGPRNDSTGDNKGIFPNEKQWSTPSTMTIEIRGIPSDIRMKEVLDIFRNVPLSPANVCIVTNNRGAEKALIRFLKASDFKEALNGQPRYVRNYRLEIVPSSDAAFEAGATANVSKPRHKPRPREEDLCVQLRGLPYSCKESDIANFFEDLTIVDMVVELSSEGKCNGIAIVQLASSQDFRTALTMNGKTMGQRYITISVASKEYIAAARGVFNPQNQRPKSPPRGSVAANNNFDAPRPTRRPNSAPGGPRIDQGPPIHPPNSARPENFCLCLRGLSERVTNKAIADFFNETGIVVKAIHLMLTPEKLPSGEGFIEVSTKEEADLALSKHNTVLLGHRISATPISFQEMTHILNGPALLPSPPLLQTPGNPDRPRRPLIPQPPNDGPFGEHPQPDYPPSDYQQFDHPPNGRPGPRGERPFPNFPPGGDRPRPDFPGPDRPRPDFPVGDRPPFFHPRGERPRMDGPPMRGMRPPMDRPMRPPFGRMRGPFPPRPRGSWDARAREQGDIGAPGCVVCIDNLHFNAGFEELLDFFKGYGLMKDNIVRWLNEHHQPTSKARVAFRNPWDAERVVRELNHKTIRGRSVKLSLL